MISLFLRFSDPAFEEKYQKDFGSIKFLQFHKFIFFELFLAEMVVTFNTAYDGITDPRIYSLISIAIIALIFAIFVKVLAKWKYLNITLIILHCFFILIYVEMIVLIKYNIPDRYYYFVIIYSSTLNIMLCSISLAKLKWIYSFSFALIYNVHYMLRIYPMDGFFPIAGMVHLCNVIAFGMITYYQEISVRGFYKLISDSHKKLENFEKLVKNVIPTPIFIMDTINEKNEFCNNSALNFLKKQGAIGTSFQELQRIMKEFKPLDSDQNFPNLKNFLNEADSKKNLDKVDFLTVDVSFCNKITEKTQFFQLKFLKLVWENKNCVLLMIDDMSDSHQIKELKKLNEYKNQLLATVSHDLRTPLNGMLGMMELVDLKITEKKDKKNLGIAIASGYLLLNMINDILDFSQINNKKLRLDIKQMDLIETIKETRKLIKFQVKSKGLEFILKTHQLSQEIIFSDFNRIRQILLNLLNNALKFTQKGFISLSIKKILDLNLNGFVYKIKVKDSGIGIKQEDFSKLFKLFGKLEQENSSLNRNGVGLGLTISQNLVKLLSSKLPSPGIHLSSEVGKGSKFWFFLAGEKCEDIILPIPSESPSNQCPRFFIGGSHEDILSENTRGEQKKQCVLVVDDDMINLMVAQRYCEYFKVGFLGATNGQEAVEIVKNGVGESRKLKGIFMDCNMPIMDGFRATENIIKFWKKCGGREIPIVGMTANVLQEDLDKCIEAGMKSFLCKPVSRNDFEKILRGTFLMSLKE